MTIEARKLKLVRRLTELNDESVIHQIENLLESETDIWDELTEKEKKIVRQGIDDLDNGRKVSYKDFKNSLTDK